MVTREQRKNMKKHWADLDKARISAERVQEQIKQEKIAYTKRIEDYAARKKLFMEGSEE